MSAPSWTRRSFLGKTVAGAAGLAAASHSAPAAFGPAPAIEPVRLDPGERLRIGIIGCGARSVHHVEGINHYDRMEIGALCDILPEKMDEKKKLVKRGSPRLYKEYQELLKQDDLHAVAIVLPNTLHREVSVAALDAGKHVLCEKPLTLDVAGTREIIAASDRNRRVLQVGTQSRHSPDYAALAKQVHEGLVGNVLYAWINTFRADWRKIYPDPEVDSRLNWRMQQKEGGAVIYEQGIHTLDVFNWLLDSQPEEITCLGGVHNQKLEKRDSWDHAGVVVRYGNGALVTYGGHLYSCGAEAPDVLYGDDSTLEIGGRGSGSARLFKRTYWRPYGMGQDPMAQSSDIDLPRSDIDPSTLQFGHFLEAVQGLKPPFPSARDHMPAVQIARGALLSMAERRHVRASEVP